MHKRKHSFLYILSVAVISVIAFYCIFQIVNYFWQMQKAKMNAKQLQTIAVITKEDNSGHALNNQGEQQDNSEKWEKDIPDAIDFASLQKISTDVTAWIYVPDTCINYVIVRGADNSYYLDHMLNGEYSSSGTVFMDYRNAADFTDWNTLIYGHHMKNGTMFAPLENYKEQEYYESHPVIYLYTAEQRYELEVLAAALVESTDAIYSISGSEEDKEEILRKLQEKSDIRTNVKTDKDDKIVTLSTCAYDFEDARFVVVGRIKENV